LASILVIAFPQQEQQQQQQQQQEQQQRQGKQFKDQQVRLNYANSFHFSFEATSRIRRVTLPLKYLMQFNMEISKRRPTSDVQHRHPTSNIQHPTSTIPSRDQIVFC